MKKLVTVTCLLGACLAQPLNAQEYPSNGYIGVFGDAAGTDCCPTTPDGTATTLYVIAVTGGASSTGITGAEFRIEVMPPAPGAILSWEAAPASNLQIGNPIDNDDSPGDDSGGNVVFADCQGQTKMAGDHILLGTITVFGLSGEHQMIVKKHNQPSNPNLRYAHFNGCDNDRSQIPLSPNEGDPQLGGQEAVVFRTPVNSPSCAGASCGFVSVQERTWSSMKDLYRR